MALDNLGIGWSKSIRESLEEYDLPTDFEVIRTTTKGLWKRTVENKIEIRNRKMLIEECHKKEGDEQVPKTKTKHILDTINNETYCRTIQRELVECNKQETKTLIIARFKMLECGRNYKGTIKEICDECKIVDDENHRINHCPKYNNFNRYNDDIKCNFSDVYSTDLQTLKRIIHEIERVWNTKTAHGTIHQ